jgi:DNA-binding transcriptional MerR regulator
MTAPFEDDAARQTRRRGMLSIGQFSRVTGLTLKTIRLYHEKGLLPPSVVDSSSGYRYYGERDVERARLVADLRALELPLAEIKALLDEHEDGAGTLAFLEAQRQRIATRRTHLGRMARELDRLIRDEKEALALAQSTQQISEKTLPPLLVGGLRWTGSYSDTGRALGQVCRRFGRYAADAPLNLYYDLEYKDEEADIESCIPLRSSHTASGFAVHTLPETRAACLVHQGPYSELSRSYARLLTHIEERGYAAVLPLREIYRKGPGLLFRGNPRTYLTEIQIPFAGP